VSRAGPALHLGAGCNECTECSAQSTQCRAVALLRFENAVQVVFAVMVLPGRRDQDPIDDDNKSLENSCVVPDAALADVPASLRALPEPTRGFVRAEELLDPAGALPRGGCNR
jgi:hypothetical protein